MKLYIAEKPSLGRAIAEALPRPHKKEDGFIRVGNGDCVSWCIGHLLEQAEPQIYDPRFKQWKLEHLPITPKQWQLQAKPKTKKQLGVLRKLIKEADQLVHAGDPDREGQLLVDQLIAFIGPKGKKRDTVQRCLINDLNPQAVRRALEQLQDNTIFSPLSVSALARSRADWLYGINMTRAYTLQGRKVGFDGLLSVGRVQTPLLGLVVQRDHAIDNFNSKPFYQVLAHLQTDNGEHFNAKWQPSDACQAYMDEEGRMLSKPLAENVVRRIHGKSAEVTETKETNKKQSAPLPYSLSALQIDAAKRFGMSAKQTLDNCQSLYERHKLLTYPRSDSRHLPAGHFSQAATIVAAIAHNSETLNADTEGVDLSLKSSAWNDKKVQAHHAIIPTEKRLKNASLNQGERQIYELVARQYLMQFYPKSESRETRISLLIEGGVFVAKAIEVLKPGWKTLVNNSGGKTKNTDSDEFQKKLPTLRKGDALSCLRGELLEKNTQAPKYFTEATLLAAMTGIARFVQDTELKKILKETDGLGTEATRAGIIELLINRDFLRRSGSGKNKHLCATDAGRGLIHALPATATTPDMTAQWESTLEAISSKRCSYDNFMDPLVISIYTLIEQSKAELPNSLKGVTAKKTAKPFKRKYKKPRANRSKKAAA